MVLAEGAHLVIASDAPVHIEAQRAIVEARETFDLVHAHPFRARQVGHEVARNLGVPFLVTLHSLYNDHLPSYADSVDSVIVVSNAIRDRLLAENAIPPERIVVIPNGVDIERFTIANKRVPAVERRRVLVASRLDRDKSFILDALCETWRRLAECRAYDIEWRIAGEGVERVRLEQAAADLGKSAGQQLVHFLGWLSEKELPAAYADADLCIAPGRCALEAMASGTATIAIGSKGYVGLIDEPTAFTGAYSNFGGVGKDACGAGQALFHDLDRVIYNRGELERLGHIGRDLVTAFFDQADLDDRMLRLYSLVRSTGPRSKDFGEVWLDEARVSPPWNDPIWYGPDAGVGLKGDLLSDGSLKVQSVLEASDRAYLRMGKQAFRRAGDGAAKIAPDARYALNCDVSSVEGRAVLQLWWIEYDSGGRRLKHDRRELHAGSNRLEVTTHNRAARVRIALRVSEAGSAIVGSLTTERKGSRLIEPPALCRRPATDDEAAYRGENLIFVFGSPRSGTTWVLRLLSEHPRVVAATEANLGIETKKRATLETNIFNHDKPFTDAQIRRRFHRLSLKNAGHMIVEKTPIHLLFADRIREVFPEAAFVLLDRDPRDIVNSLVSVGRDPNACWKGAPDTVSAAIRLWRRYAKAAQRVRQLYNPRVVAYEKLSRDPVGEFSALLATLGLEKDSVDKIVYAAAGGKGISIPGVYREGRVGAWRSDLSPEEIAQLETLVSDFE
jgi:glycosyltransferase involved in cell wall biosynthesis